MFLSFTNRLDAQEVYFTENELREIQFESYERVNSNSLAFPLKRVFESLRLSLASDSKKNKIKKEHLENRFGELVYIVNFQKTGFLAETVSRYITTTGSIEQTKSREYTETLEKYITILEILRDRHEANSSYWLSI